MESANKAPGDASTKLPARVIDTHQHLWDQKQFRYSWTAKNSTFNRSFLVKDYLEATRGLNVVKSVHVEADVDEEFMLGETLHVLSLTKQAGSPVAGVVAAARPEKEGFADYIHQIAGHPGLKGIRRILHVVPDDVSTTPLFAKNVASLADHNLSFDICVLGRQLPLAINLIKQCPKVSFILDHCGNPDIKSGRDDQWSKDLVTVAAFPNVACKVSGIVVNTDIPNWKVEDLRPAVEHVINTFGWDRVMFGSDWPVCTLAASFKQWFDALNLIVKDASDTNRQKLFHDNAERIYRLNNKG